MCVITVINGLLIMATVKLKMYILQYNDEKGIGDCDLQQ